MFIEKIELQRRVDEHFHDKINENGQYIKTINAKELLTYNRLDIAFKLLYLDGLKYGTKSQQLIYKEHIMAFSLGKFTEPGNKEKNSIDKYYEAFNDIFKSINKNGFDFTKTLIPLSNAGSIVNGAHRLASAIHLDKKISYINIDIKDYSYDYKFFYSRNVPLEMLDAATTKFVECANNVYIACLWPTATGYDKEIEKIIPNIVYRKELKLNQNGAHNLLSQIYYGETWLGDVENNFSGAEAKLIECFRTFEPVRIIAFQADSLDEVLIIKENVRTLFNVGKHSVHITDTKEEAIRTAKVVFNNNSIHFLNYAKPNKYISTHNKIKTFKKFIKANGLSENDVLIDSSFILSVYGLREAKDTDFFCDDNSKIKHPFDDINTHDEELKYHGEAKNEIIHNHNFNFYFNGLKFISFDQLYRMKKTRAEEKDKNDCMMMAALIEKNKFKEVINNFKQNIYYTKAKLKHEIIAFLKRHGLYEMVRNIYRLIKVNK